MKIEQNDDDRKSKGQSDSVDLDSDRKKDKQHREITNENGLKILKDSLASIEEAKPASKMSNYDDTKPKSFRTIPGGKELVSPAF